MSANGISTLGTGTPAEIKEDRQIAKLDIAQAKRQGKVVAVDGTITGVADDTKPYYRYWNVYDRVTLSLPYNVADAATVNPLADHRPWATNVAAAPVPVGVPTVNTQLNAPTQPTITGTYDNVNSTSFTVTVDGTTYTLGVDAALTTDGANIWSLDLSVAGQTLATETSFDVVATSNGTTSDTTTDEITTINAIEDIVADAATSLQIWYDGSDVTQFQPTNPSDGDTITQWNDKSDFAHNANPIGGATYRPTYQTNELGGLSVVEFDGVDDCLSVNPFTQIAGATNFTIFMVAKTIDTTRQQVFGATNNSDLKIELVNDGGTYKYCAAINGGSGVSSVAADTNYHILTLRYDGNGVGNANKVNFRVDKVAQTLNFTGAINSTTLGSNTHYYFGCAGSMVGHLDGSIAEVLMFSKSLTPTEIDDVEQYLNTHWTLGL